MLLYTNSTDVLQRIACFWIKEEEEEKYKLFHVSCHCHQGRTLWGNDDDDGMKTWTFAIHNEKGNTISTANAAVVAVPAIPHSLR